MKCMVILFLALVISMTVTPGFEASGYSFVGITNNGVEFPIKSGDGDGDGEGDGTAVLDGIGVSLAIHNIITNGILYFGDDTTGVSTDIRPYVGVDTDTDWVVAIADDYQDRVRQVQSTLRDITQNLQLSQSSLSQKQSDIALLRAESNTLQSPDTRTLDGQRRLSELEGLVSGFKLKSDILNSEYHELARISQKTPEQQTRWIELAGLLDTTGTDGLSDEYNALPAFGLQTPEQRTRYAELRGLADYAYQEYGEIQSESQALGELTTRTPEEQTRYEMLSFGLIRLSQQAITELYNTIASLSSEQDLVQSLLDSIESAGSDRVEIPSTYSDRTITQIIPEFAKKYRYDGHSLVDVTSDSSNILGYSKSKSMSGTSDINLNNEGIVLSGTGVTVIKLYSYNNDVLLRGTLSNADVKIVTSPLDLTALTMDGIRYIVSQTTPSKHITSSITEFHRCIKAGGCSGGITHIHQTWDMVSTPDVVVASDSDLTGKYFSRQTCLGIIRGDHCLIPGLSSTIQPLDVIGNSILTKLTVSDGVRITKQVTSGSKTEYTTKTHTIYSESPWNQRYSFTDSFTQRSTLPANSYMIVTLNDGSATIKGESFDSDSDAFLKVTGLPVDAAFDVSKNGITGVVGKTGSDGTISLPYDDVDFGISTSKGGLLQVYPNAVSYLGNLGATMLDMYHKESVQLSVGEDFVYIPQNYVRWIFPVAVEITNVRVDNLKLNYLNGNYTKNDALVIPIIPRGDTIYATINGTDTEVLMRDVSVATQIKQVLKKSSTSSDHSNGGPASTSSNIATSTFLTATHDGIAIANIDIKVGGSAEFSLSSGYDGEFDEVLSCRTNYGTERLNSSCRLIAVPTNPDAITNLQSFTSSHRDQMVTALNNGQLSAVTVDVDIVKNMEFLKTVTIYTSDSAQASQTSSFGATKYGASNSVRIVYPLTSITDNIAIPVSVGDMIEYVIRVNLDAKGAPVPASDDGSYSSYVSVTTKFGGGVITVGMS